METVMADGPVARYETELWRRPNAEAVRQGGRWLVALGHAAIEVLPAGVEPHPDNDNEREPLRESLYVVHGLLRDIAEHDGEAAARLLADHCRKFPAPILCQHGLGVWHQVEGRRGCHTPALPDGSIVLDVENTFRMVRGLEGIEAATRYLATQRKPIRAGLVEAALVWPVLPEWFVGVLRGELERDGCVSVSRGQQMVTMTMSEAFRQAGLRLSFEWLPMRRPELALSARSDLAAYVSEFAQALGVIGGAQPTIRCLVCGQPYTPMRKPKPGSTYCTRPECQRERKRRNQARRRAEQKSGE